MSRSVNNDVSMGWGGDQLGAFERSQMNSCWVMDSLRQYGRRQSLEGQAHWAEAVLLRRAVVVRWHGYRVVVGRYPIGQSRHALNGFGICKR